MKNVNNRKIYLILITISLFLLFTIYRSNEIVYGATSYGSNLVINGNAEAGLANWTPSSPGFVADTPGSLGVSASPDGGKLFDYYPEPGPGTASMYQEIDISDISSDVDAGNVKLDLTGWGKFVSSDPGSATIRLEFLNSSDGAVSAPEELSITANTGNNWQAMSLNNKVLPLGTRKLKVTLVGTISDTNGNDYIEFDGISLILTNTGISAPNPPVVTGSTPTNDTTPTWSWTSGGGGNGNYRYKLDNSDLSTGSIPTTETTYTPATALPEGPHILYVQEKNAAGNWSPSGSFTITIDTTPPIKPGFTGSNTPVTNDTTPTWYWISGGGGGNGNYRYKLDDSNLSIGSTLTTNLYYTPPTALAEGPHTLYVQERDAVGNWSESASFTVTIDTTAPDLSSVSPADGAGNVAVNADLVITFSENVVKGTTGKITIKQTTGDSTVVEIPVTSSDISVSNKTVTISHKTLAINTGYYVLITPGAFKDTAGNDYAGISNKGTWNFTTMNDTTPPTVTNTALSSGDVLRPDSMLIVEVSDEAGTGINPSSIVVSFGGVTSTGSNVITGGKLYHLIKLTLAHETTGALTVTIEDYAGNSTTATLSGITWENERKGFGFGRLDD